MATGAKQTTATTVYRILEQVEITLPLADEKTEKVQAFVERGKQAAHGDLAALRAHFGEEGPPVGKTFVAVPARSFRERTTRPRQVKASVVFA